MNESAPPTKINATSHGVVFLDADLEHRHLAEEAAGWRNPGHAERAHREGRTGNPSPQADREEEQCLVQRVDHGVQDRRRITGFSANAERNQDVAHLAN